MKNDLNKENSEIETEEERQASILKYKEQYYKELDLKIARRELHDKKVIEEELKKRTILKKNKKKLKYNQKYNIKPIDTLSSSDLALIQKSIVEGVIK